MTFHAVGDDTNFTYMVKVNSPLLANVEVYKYGSNKNRKKLNHIPALELSSSKVTEPIIKGRNFKKRVDLGTSKVKPKKNTEAVEGLVLEKPTKGKIRKGSI